MPAIKSNDLLLRLVRDVNDIRSALRRTVSNLPLFDISNENTPASLSTNQNNYVPGNYDILRINATADISITGFSGGLKGRFLEILNVGTGRISFPDESASSLAANRIATPYNQTVVLLTNARVRFYYDSTQSRWMVSDLPNIQGQFGKFALLSHSSTTVQTVAASANTVITPNTVVSDEWGYWTGGNKFQIPTGESGLYLLFANFRMYDSTSEAAFSYSINLNASTGKTVSDEGVFNSAFGIRWNVSAMGYFVLDAGDYVQCFLQQNSTGNIDVETRAVGNPILVFSKVG